MSDTLQTGHGKVKFFNDTKGYGFILLDDQQTEVFVHQTKIKMDGHRTLHENQPVEIEYYKEEKGWKAETVKPDMEWAAKNVRAGEGRRGGRGGDEYHSGYSSDRRYDDRRDDRRGGSYNDYGGRDRGYGGGGYDRNYSSGGYSGGGGGGYGSRGYGSSGGGYYNEQGSAGYGRY